ncbi:MAG TPA: hemerythrin domain-containing protein [Puia sp.]
MHTPRFNAFNQIHKAYRTLMFDTVMQLQHSDFGNPESCRAAIDQTSLLLELMDDHAHHEDTFILHAAESKAPDLIHEFESEHVTDLALSNQLREKIAAYWQAEDKALAGKEIYYALNAFVAFNLQHMNKEELVLNPVLWQHYSDQELLGIVQNIQRSISPEKMNIAAEWMIKGLANTELIPWLKAVQAEAPAPAYEALLAATRQHLPAARWAFVEKQL